MASHLQQLLNRIHRPFGPALPSTQVSFSLFWMVQLLQFSCTFNETDKSLSVAEETRKMDECSVMTFKLKSVYFPVWAFMKKALNVS